MRIAFVVPHIFMHQQLLSDVIFSPGFLAMDLAAGLSKLGHDLTLFSPGSVANYLPKKIKNVSADLSLFEQELEQRGYGYLELLKKHPLTYITLARQVQSELIAQAYQLANENQFDLVHVWCNEEELALVNARFCQKPVVFNHHEPFNFLVRYRSLFSKYKNLNWVSFSYAQRQTFTTDEQKVNWAGNVYHGLKKDLYKFVSAEKTDDYLLYMGRIIKPKGVHYAIQVAKNLGKRLKIAGKHYAGHSKDKYWQEFIEPEIDGQQIQYVGFVKEIEEKQKLLGQAHALLMPSTWQEPFGLVMVEALACGTPVVGFSCGAVPEVIKDGVTGWVVSHKPEPKMKKNQHLVNQDWGDLQNDEVFAQNVANLAMAVKKIKQINRQKCRAEFEQRFTVEKMSKGYDKIYKELLK